MVLIDTSAWVEFSRATGSAAHVHVRSLIDRNRPILTTDVVIMELLAGARDDNRAAELRRFLLGFTHAPVRGLADFPRRTSTGIAGIASACGLRIHPT